MSMLKKSTLSFLSVVPERLFFLTDMHRLNYVHAAYIRGSVPTAAQEADDIITDMYPDEVRYERLSWAATLLDWHAQNILR
jgi:hypothetical protein